jgi:hypothetical protein
MLVAQGELAAVRPLFERSLAVTEQMLGPDHPSTATIRSNLNQFIEETQPGR